MPPPANYRYLIANGNAMRRPCECLAKIAKHVPQICPCNLPRVRLHVPASVPIRYEVSTKSLQMEAAATSCCGDFLLTILKPVWRDLVYDSSAFTNCCSAYTRCAVALRMFTVALTIRLTISSLNIKSGVSRIASMRSFSSRS